MDSNSLSRKGFERWQDFSLKAEATLSSGLPTSNGVYVIKNDTSFGRFVAVCFARAKLSTAISVSLSDWLGGDRCILVRTRFRTDSIILETTSKNAIPSFWYLIKRAFLVSALSERGDVCRKTK